MTQLPLFHFILGFLLNIYPLEHWTEINYNAKCSFSLYDSIFMAQNMEISASQLESSSLMDTAHGTMHAP